MSILGSVTSWPAGGTQMENVQSTPVDFTGQVLRYQPEPRRAVWHATLDVLHDATVQRVRLWGIDAPEKKQPFGTRAKEFAANLVFAKEVRVRVRGIDRYKRTLGEIVTPDGRNLGHELLRAGLARWYVQFAKNERGLADLEQEARTARRGLWSESGAMPPWEWRKARH
jgi:micrococcal nuclease